MGYYKEVEMADKKVVSWFTVNGKHIPIYEGETKRDAVSRLIGSKKTLKASKNAPVPKKAIDDAWNDYENKSRMAEYDVNGDDKKAEIDAARRFDKVVRKGAENGTITKVKFNRKSKDSSGSDDKDYYIHGNSKYSLSKSGKNVYLTVGGKDGKGQSFKYKVAYAGNPEKARANLGGTGSMAYLNFKDHPELAKLLKKLK